LLPDNIEVAVRGRTTRIPEAVRQELKRLKVVYDDIPHVPKKGVKRTPRPHPYKAAYRHRYWFIDESDGFCLGRRQVVAPAHSRGVFPDHPGGSGLADESDLGGPEAPTALECEQRHQAFIQTYNTTAHQGLQKEHWDRPIPVEVLGATRECYSREPPRTPWWSITLDRVGVGACTNSTVSPQ
jgi:hypothetical protein